MGRRAAWAAASALTGGPGGSSGPRSVLGRWITRCWRPQASRRACAGTLACCPCRRSAGAQHAGLLGQGAGSTFGGAPSTPRTSLAFQPAGRRACGRCTLSVPAFAPGRQASLFHTAKIPTAQNSGRTGSNASSTAADAAADGAGAATLVWPPKRPDPELRSLLRQPGGEPRRLWQGRSAQARPCRGDCRRLTAAASTATAVSTVAAMAAVDLTAGTCAGIAQLCFGHPFDTTKVRWEWHASISARQSALL